MISLKMNRPAIRRTTACLLSLLLALPAWGGPIEPGVRYFHYDPGGNVVLVTDEQGQAVSELGYSAYGIPDPARSRNAGVVHYGWGGHELDRSTALQYKGARYYSPELSRFISPDPARQGASGYAALADDPLAHSDPDGRSWKHLYWWRAGGRSAIWAGIGAVVGGVIGGLSAGISTNSGANAAGGVGAGVIAGAALGGGLGLAAHYLRFRSLLRRPADGDYAVYLNTRRENTGQQTAIASGLPPHLADDYVIPMNNIHMPAPQSRIAALQHKNGKFVVLADFELHNGRYWLRLGDNAPPALTNIFPANNHRRAANITWIDATGFVTLFNTVQPHLGNHPHIHLDFWGTDSWSFVQELRQSFITANTYDLSLQGVQGFFESSLAHVTPRAWSRSERATFKLLGLRPNGTRLRGNVLGAGLPNDPLTPGLTVP